MWRFLICLFALLPGLALAAPQDGVYTNPDNVLLSVTAAGDGGFDFQLVAWGTDGDNVCAEGDTHCLQIDGHAEASSKGYTYIDPNDDHSRIFFAEVDGGLRILSTIGDLGTGLDNRAQKSVLRGIYTKAQDSTDASGGMDNGVADQLEFFKSPTGNIACLFAFGDGVTVRCDLMQLNRSFTQQPNDCGEDWGDSFGVGEGSKKGQLLCHGDTVADPSAAVLDYGSTISHGGITCSSAKAGMTCQNAAGHGFTVARKAQRLF